MRRSSDASRGSPDLARRLGLSVNILDELLDRFAYWPSVERAVVYGSRARGDFRTQSDIDIAVHGALTDRERTDLWLALDDAPIVHGLDFVHYEAPTTSDALRRAIDRDGLLIYERDRGSR